MQGVEQAPQPDSLPALVTETPSMLGSKTARMVTFLSTMDLPSAPEPRSQSLPLGSPPSKALSSKCPKLMPVLFKNKVFLTLLFLYTNPQTPSEAQNPSVEKGVTADMGALEGTGAPRTKAHRMEAWYCVQVNVKPLSRQPVQPGHSRGLRRTPESEGTGQSCDDTPLGSVT